MGKNSIRLNSIYLCHDKEKLEQYREKLYAANKDGNYPTEEELPDISVDENKEIDWGGTWGKPYYSEIDINCINSTNTSSCEKVYSNYERVIGSIPYIIKNECRPIAILKDGDKYCVLNGKHRFLAYTLLGINTIPVSIQERCTDKEKESDIAIEYIKKLYEDGGYKISYPEKIMEFYDGNKELFKDIRRVEMKCLEENKRYCLEIENGQGDIIRINDGISAGNEYRSSRVVEKLLSSCGYDINMEYIKKHPQFVLSDNKYGIHNIIFDKNIFIDENKREDILSKTGNWTPYLHDDAYDNIHKSKINQLHNFLSEYAEFETMGTNLTVMNSGMISDKEKDIAYYFVGSDSIEGDESYIYIFEDKESTKSNLNVRYLGRIGEDDDLYKKITQLQ